MWCMEESRAWNECDQKNMAHTSIGNVAFLVLLDLFVDLLEYLLKERIFLCLEINYLCGCLP